MCYVEVQRYPSIYLSKHLPLKAFTSESVSERALRSIEAAEFAVKNQAPILIPSVELPSCDSLWTEANSWKCHVHLTVLLEPRTQAANRRTRSGMVAHLVVFADIFQVWQYHEAKRTSKSQPQAQERFYLRLGRNHPGIPSDC